MTPTFPYTGSEHSPLWWSLGLLVIALVTCGLLVLFVVGSSRAQGRTEERGPRVGDAALPTSTAGDALPHASEPETQGVVDETSVADDARGRVAAAQRH